MNTRVNVISAAIAQIKRNAAILPTGTTVTDQLVQCAASCAYGALTCRYASLAKIRHKQARQYWKAAFPVI